jgi:putative FmdB family regulatory protein
MPIFEYVCRDCGHAFETIVTGSRQPECPSCSSAALEKQLSVFAVSAPAAGSDVPMPSSGGCCRCGDPNGPCSMN